MTQGKQRKQFRSLFAEKMMDFGNIIIVVFVLSQFISEKDFSFLVFTLGIIIAILSYVVSYLISD